MTPEELMKQIAEGQANMAKAVASLTESITARFSSVAPAAKSAEDDKLAKQVLDLQKTVEGLQAIKSVRKMVYAVTGKAIPEGAEGVRFNRFLKAVKQNDMPFFEGMKAATGQSSTAADGGYAIPTDYANSIIELERPSSIMRNLVTVLPMGAPTRRFPKELTSPLTYWTGEGTAPTAQSKGTLTHVTQTAKKINAIVAFTKELLEDNIVNYDSFIAGRIAKAMGRSEDLNVLVGDVSGLSDPFNGAFFASGVNSVSLDGAALSYDDIVSLWGAVGSEYRGRGAFLLNTTGLMKIMKMKDDENRPIWTMPAAGNPGMILGRPYYESDQIPNTLGTTRTNGLNTAIMYGAWDAVMVSPLGEYSVEASNAASDDSGTGNSAFMKGEIWYRFERRESIDVMNGEALAKLAVPA